jgi:PKD repeat protein
VVFYANTGTGLTYQWYRNGSPISGATGSSYVATLAGSYMVAVTNSSNCTTTSSVLGVTINPLPTATISASGATTFCSGSSVDLNAPTGTGFSYIWMLNGSAISGATSATYTASASGDYTVQVTDAHGCSATSSATAVTVNALPNTSVNVIGSATRCQGDSVQMAANTRSGYTYQWKKDGVNITGATSAAYTAKASGTYKVVITNSNGCTDSSSGTSVTINPLPQAVVTTLSGSTTFCSGGSVTMDALTGIGYTYQWLMDNSPISGATSSSYTANQSGSYTLMVTNASGCSSVSRAVPVTVNPLPVTTVTPYGTTTRCQGDSVILNANSVSGYKYQWELNGLPIKGATSSSYAAKASGTYKVVISNSFGCSDSSSGTAVTINPLPSVRILASTSTSICAGGSSYLSLSSTVSGTTYQWQRDGKDISGATSSIFLASQAGSYTVKATNASGCSNISNAITVIVNALPTPAVSALGTTTFCEGDSVTLITGTSAGNKYQWQMDGADITGATDANITVHQSGNYRVVVTNASGCTDSSKHITITVNPLPNPQVFAFGPATFCEGGSVLIKAKVVAAGTSYQWFKDGVAMSGDSTGSIIANKTGVYQLLETITTTGCSVRSNTVTVTVNPAPSSTIQPLGATTFCSGGSVILYGGSATGKHYYWFRSGNYINIGNVNTITAADSGSYTLVTQDSASGCSSTSKAVTVTLIALPQAVIMQPATSTYCEGASAYLHVDKSLLPAGKNTYQWYVDGLIIPRATNDSLLVTATGDYTVEVTSEFGCVNRSIAQGMTFNAAPVVKYTFPHAACATVPVNFINRSYVPDNSLTYMWTFGDGDSSDVESPSHAYKSAGKYKIVLYATSGTGCTSMFMDSIVVRKATSPDFTVAHIGPRLFTYTAKDTTGTDYKWYFGDGMTATGTTAEHEYFVDGTYQVILQATNASGCVTSFADSVSVNSTGVAEKQLPGTSMSIYPNPFITNSNITYTLGRQSNVTLEVYDMLGQKVETMFNGQQESGKYVFTFDSRKQGIPSDVYIVKLRVDQNVYIQRLVRVQ